MRETALGDLKVRIAGGSDREGGGDGPVLVLLHGFGAPGTDLVSLFRVIDAPEGTRFVFPEAPLDLGAELGMMGARAWWRIDVMAMQMAMLEGKERDLSNETPDGLAEARDQVVGMLDALERELGVAGNQIVLGGFSQGAMLSCDVALRTGRELAGLVLMSGTLLCADEWARFAKDRPKLPILQSHGRQDPLLPFGAAERLRDTLTGAKLDVQWIPFSGQHTIPDSVIQALGPFVAHALDRSTE